MKLATFSAAGRTRLGALRGDRWIDLNAAAQLAADAPQTVADSLRELLAGGEPALARAAAALAAVDAADPPALAGVAFRRDEITLLPPIPDPSKILAIGQNYRDPCAEQNVPVPEALALFAKYPSALVGDGQPIRLPPVALTQQVDYEAELAFVIGRGGCNIPLDEAYEHVAGYTICHDVSARDVQFGDGGKQWVHGKSFDTFCPLGPVLVTRDELPDPHTLDISLEINGECLQRSNTHNLVFTVPFLVSELSRSLTLCPGDIVTTGTPGGVGFFRQPQRFLRPGDEVIVRIAGIGELRNPVIAGCG
ncbi:MAG: fumarylacetoacetate hydrolase family protein [Fimbriimonadaceae bacterium]|nr:fumarylacetoacetate hydrolase family protein [Fimbriimonadaceae bacterium]